MLSREDQPHVGTQQQSRFHPSQPKGTVTITHVPAPLVPIGCNADSSQPSGTNSTSPLSRATSHSCCGLSLAASSPGSSRQLNWRGSLESSLNADRSRAERRSWSKHFNQLLLKLLASLWVSPHGFSNVHTARLVPSPFCHFGSCCGRRVARFRNGLFLRGKCRIGKPSSADTCP